MSATIQKRVSKRHTGQSDPFNATRNREGAFKSHSTPKFRDKWTTPASGLELDHFHPWVQVAVVF